MIRSRHLALFTILWLSIGSTVFAADLGFARHYTSNMVLQREKPVLIRGFADKGENVTVMFFGQSKNGKADPNGEWSVVLDPMAVNAKGTSLTVECAGKSATLNNVVVGDVFLFGRQTSIDVSLGRDDAGKKAAAAVPSVRVITIKTTPALEPQQDLAPAATSGWTALDKDAALTMNAAAFYVARDLAKTADVPIGIIDLNLGYHFPIAWLSKDALLQTKEIFDGAGQIDSIIKMMDGKRKAYADSKGDDPEAASKHLKRRAGIPLTPAQDDARYPAAGYNAVLHPMRGLALKGLLLQLGNDYPYYIYARLKKEGKITSGPHLGLAYEDTYDIRKWCGYVTPFTVPRLPREWRKTFGDDALPVGLITPPASDLATMAMHHYELREVQRQTAEKEKGVHLIQPSIKHIPFSAQPADDALLAKRCMAWLSAAVYGKGVPTGPLFDRAETNGPDAQVFFKPGTANGLKAAPGALDQFEVAGLDMEYAPAKATIDGDSIRLSNDTVEKVFYVRYNWKQKPDQGLTNASGLPAVPFKTDDKPFTKRIFHPNDPLPVEFSTSITEWKTDGPVIYKGKMNSGAGGGKFLGPTGIKVTPFGPNLFVNNVYVGSPADGKIFHGDYLYAVNGKLFVKDSGDKAIYLQIADEITKAETEEGKGLISFEVYRDGKKLTVELKLEVLGTYSATSPYNCDKTDRIVANAEAYLAKYGGAPFTINHKGRRSYAHSHFRASDALFLLGAGSPEYQGLVRRHVYTRLEGGGSWNTSADLLLLAEYYLATGDKTILPALGKRCDAMTACQIRPPEKGDTFPVPAPGASGGWRHGHPGGYYYGTMPAIGVPATLGYHLATEAGAKFDERGYQRAVNWFVHNGAKVGALGYGFSAKPVTSGNHMPPERVLNGKLGAGNGAVGGAAVLFDLIGDGTTSRTCSFVATHSWSNTWYAHGGHFWLNMYTPLGARVHGEDSFKYYMQNSRGYQELHRMHDYSRQQDRAVGAGQYLAYVVPRARLRITGAHPSVFAPNPPEVLKPALDAYDKRDYAASEKAVRAILDKGDLNGLDLKKAEQLRDAAVLIQKSIELDLAKMKTLIAEKKPYEASLYVNQVKVVVPEGHPELAAIEETLGGDAMKAAMKDDQKRYDAYLATLPLRLPAAKKEAETDDKGWQYLVSPRRKAAKGQPEPVASVWRMKVLESLSLAPKDWMAPGFDDSSWTETTMPISWRDNHTSLLRTTFDIDDPGKVKALRMNQYAFQNRSIQVFINGKLVAKITDSGGGSRITVPLNDHAVSLLKKGKNTFAATYKHHWRWGRYFKGAGSVYEGGIKLSLQMQEE